MAFGWECLHVAVDDRSRPAFTQLLPSERKEDATAFPGSSLAWFRHHGVPLERVMTDNGPAYKSMMFAALEHHGIAHERTRPYNPQDQRQGRTPPTPPDLIQPLAENHPSAG